MIIEQQAVQLFLDLIFDRGVWYAHNDIWQCVRIERCVNSDSKYLVTYKQIGTYSGIFRAFFVED